MCEYFEIIDGTLDDYEISADAYLPFIEWKEKYCVMLEDYPETFDLKLIYLDIACATYWLGLPVPIEVLPLRNRLKESQLSLVDKVMHRILVYCGWPRTYAGLYDEFQKLRVPATRSNHIFAGCPVLARKDEIILDL